MSLRSSHQSHHLGLAISCVLHVNSYHHVPALHLVFGPLLAHPCGGNLASLGKPGLLNRILTTLLHLLLLTLPLTAIEGQPVASPPRDIYTLIPKEQLVVHGPWLRTEDLC